MATAVESPGIASAKEEAAAILFARETQTPPVMTAPAPEQSVRSTHEQPQYHTSFTRYHEPQAIPVRPKAVDTTELRPYPTYDETTTVVEPQVVRPYIDSSDYLSAAVAATSVAAPTQVVTPTIPVMTVTEAPQTVTVVESPLDTQLEEDTQYVVKFKNSTIVAATIVATIMLLMTVLFVVNIVNLVTASAEVNALLQESTTLEQSLAEGQASLEQARETADADGVANHNVQYVDKAESTYTRPNGTTSSSFFDWLCHSLSRLFG